MVLYNDDDKGRQPGDNLGDDDLFEEMVSAAMGEDIPHPVDWAALDAAERRDELLRLWPWVAEMARTWPIGRDVLPPCWYRHESLVRIMSAARDAYLTAFDPTQAASAAADWMYVWDATIERLMRWGAASSCTGTEHHPDRLQPWVADAKEAAAATTTFEEFVTANYQDGSRDEVPDRTRR